MTAPTGLVTAAISVPHINYPAILPELILIGAALVVMLGGALTARRLPSGTWATVTVVAAAASIGASWYLWYQVDRRGPHETIAGAVAVDGYSVFFLITIGVALLLGALVADDFLRRESLEGPEFYVLAMLSAAGAQFMAAANDLIVVFLGLEILSIALYVLAGYQRRRAQSQEAALKYFVLGSFSSAIFLYGIALTYGATGSTNLTKIATYLASNVLVNNGLLLAGMALLIVGLGFKVAAVPFHNWSPDVYQGSPTPVTGYMAAAAKAAGFAGLLRILFSAFGVLRSDWQPVIVVIAAVTLALGAVAALVQTDIKRLLAYSSINHAGFVLVGLAAATKAGISAALYYLLVYTFMVIGSFAVVALVGRKGDIGHTLDDYRGLARRRPVLGLVFAVLLLAQSGVPFTTGFLAKFYVISAAVQARSYPLAILAMVFAVVAAFYYLKVILLMYGEPVRATGRREEPVLLPAATSAVLGLTLVFTVAFGLVPGPIIHFAHQASLLF